VANFDESGNQGVAFVLDMTERKQAEAEARENERRYREVQTELAHGNRVATMGLLTASIAHEVNQPLAATITNAHAGRRWLDRRPPDLEEARHAFDRIVREGNRAAEVVGSIRALVKKAPSRTEHLEVNEAIREVVELTHGEAVKQSVALEMQLADGLPPIGGDRVQLQQVVLNLTVNAIQALGTVAGGTRKVLISTRRTEQGGVVVAVIDSGPGLAPATLARIFEPFYTTKSSGLGMGLSICHSIIEAHGGRLWAEANEPRGTIFQFTLPIQPEGAL
jgi:C4-dicarboxylate-specific signal transduction histidine kinase